MIGAWRGWARTLKRNTYALYLAARHPRVPVLAKILVVLVAAYALSPIDLIPDFIPVLGYLDDMLLLPLGIALAIKLVPGPIWEECRQKAELELSGDLPRSRAAAAVIVAIWLLAISITLFIIWRNLIQRR